MSTTLKSTFNLEGIWLVTQTIKGIPTYHFQIEIDALGKATVGRDEYFGTAFANENFFILTLKNDSTPRMGDYFGKTIPGDHPSVTNGVALTTEDGKRIIPATWSISYLSSPIDYGIGINKGLDLAFR